jgi:ribosomal protein L24
MFMRKYFQQRGLQSWDVPRIPHKIYVEATSPHDIRCNAPPSRTSAIRDITLLPDEEHAWFRKADISMRLHSWVRVRRGLYRNDIGYVLACNQTSSDLLLVPRQRPYDDIDEHDVPEVKAQKRRERKLFDPTVAKNAAHSVLPFNTRAGIFRCNDVFYHRGLMRRTFPNDAFEVIGLPHPDDIALHAEAQVDPDLIHRTYLSFSYQFWKEGDLVRIRVGSFEGERATIVAVTLDEGSAKVSLGDSSVYDVPLADLCRLFRGGDTVKVLAGVHRGYLGTVIAVAEDTVTLLLDKTMEVVSKMQSCQVFL